MKRTMSILAVAGSIIAIVACSSTPKPSGVAPITYEEMNTHGPQMPPVPSEKRQPSSQITSESEPANFTIRTGDEGYRQTVTVHKYLEYDYACEIEQEVEVISRGEVDCDQLICSNGSGKSPAWSDYYAGGGDKAEALRRAIKGLNKDDAQTLHDKKYFMKAGRGKPKSWEQFVDILGEAVQARDLSLKEFKEITKQFGLNNAENLGYSGNCSFKPSRCQGPIMTGTERRRVQSTCHQRISQGSTDYTLVFRAIGGKFLPGVESDRIYATVKENVLEFEIKSGSSDYGPAYNTYKMTQSFDASTRTFEAVAQATARNLISPPARDSVRTSMDKTADGRYKFGARVGKEFVQRLASVDPGAQVVVEYQTMGCEKVGWMLGGGCSLIKDYFKIPNVSGSTVMSFSPGTPDLQVVEVNGPGKGQATWVHYLVRVIGSSLYNSEPFIDSNSETIYK